MEARLSLEGTEDRNVAKPHHVGVVGPVLGVVTAEDNRSKPRAALAAPTTTTPAKKVSTTSAPPSNSAASKANKAAERLAAWQRRKNYDPLKAATNGKVQQVKWLIHIPNLRTAP